MSIAATIARKSAQAYFEQAFQMLWEQHPYVQVAIVWNLNFRAIVPATDEKYGFGLVNAGLDHDAGLRSAEGSTQVGLEATASTVALDTPGPLHARPRIDHGERGRPVEAVGDEVERARLC